MSNFLLKFGDRSELYRIVRAKKDLESLYEIQSLENPSRVGEVFFDRRQVDVRDANTGAVLRTYTGNWKLVKQVEELDPESVVGDRILKYVVVNDPNLSIYLINPESEPYVEKDIEKAVLENTNYRKVIKTTPNSQLVYMCLMPGQIIPSEIHTVDQFIRVEGGTGFVRFVYPNGEAVEFTIEADTAFVVPAGVDHMVMNNNDKTMLQLYTVYSGPTHIAGLTEPYPSAIMTN